MVFAGLNLEVARGERLAVIGESGAGKSTLLHILGGLDRPSDGAIYFGNNDIARFSERELAEFRNQEIGFVWQNHSLLPEFTAQENVMMPLLIRGVSRAEGYPLALERLQEVGLGSRASHRAGELSGGEQQRVALARALAARPTLLLADEPTGNLDHGTGEMIMGLLEELHRSHRLTSVYVTHNIKFAERADRILKMERGSLVSDERAAEALPETVDGSRPGGMFERFSEKARRVIFFARYEASQFGSRHIATEHLLLGLLREDKELATAFLGSDGALDSIRKQIEAHTMVAARIPTSVDLPLSGEGKRVLAYAAEEGSRLRHKDIGPGHLLLGLLREEKSYAAEILRERGVFLERARETIARLPAP